MLTLEELLKEKVQRLGRDHPAVQILQNQITAEKSGKTFQELYTSREDEEAPSNGHKPDISVLPRKGD